MTRNLNFFLLIIAITVLLFSCKKQKEPRSETYIYQANAAYSGSHPTQGLQASIHLMEEGDHLLFHISMQGIDVSKEYKLHIHSSQPALPFGYSGNPEIDLGTMKNGSMVSASVQTYSYDYFTRDFKGYFIVHDPGNVNNDTSTLLIFGKTGSDW